MDGGKAPAQIGVGDDDVAGHRAGDVEGLGAGGQHHRPVQHLRRRQRHRHVPVTRQHEVVVNLVRDQDHQVALGSELGQRAKLLPAPDAAARVVRGAEDHDPLVAGKRCPERIQVHAVAAVLLHERRFDDPPAVCAQHPVEGVVDRREQDHALAGRR